MPVFFSLHWSRKNIDCMFISSFFILFPTSLVAACQVWLPPRRNGWDKVKLAKGRMSFFLLVWEMTRELTITWFHCCLYIFWEKLGVVWVQVGGRVRTDGYLSCKPWRTILRDDVCGVHKGKEDGVYLYLPTCKTHTWLNKYNNGCAGIDTMTCWRWLSDRLPVITNQELWRFLTCGQFHGARKAWSSRTWYKVGTRGSMNRNRETIRLERLHQLREINIEIDWYFVFPLSL